MALIYHHWLLQITNTITMHMALANFMVETLKLQLLLHNHNESYDKYPLRLTI